MSDEQYDDREEELFHRYAGQAMQALITAAWTNPGPAQAACKEYRQALSPGRDASFNDWVASQSYQYAAAMVTYWREVAYIKDDKGSGTS